jgi:hypothetical protein
MSLASQRLHSRGLHSRPPSLILFSLDLMTTMRFLVIFLLALTVSVRATAAEPPLVSGLWHKGHNITEPRPKSSNFMRVVEGGFLILPTAAAYRLEVEVSSKLSTPYFMRALFENPADPANPFLEESVMSQPQKILTLTHGPVKGLRISGDYRITIKIFHRKGDAEPIDVLEQKVRAYVDSTGAAIKMKGGMKAQ